MPRHRRRLAIDRLDDRTTPANLAITNLRLVDASNALQANPVYGQAVYFRAEWNAQSFAGTEAATPVRYTVNFPAGYFNPGSAAVSYPADSSLITYAAGTGSHSWYRSGWYAGTATFTVTATLDPDNQIAETNEADNSMTITVTPAAPTDLPMKFVQPIGLRPNRDWAINNYADVDPRAGTQQDFRGGIYQYDGHDAIDEGPWGFREMDAGIPVLAAADGTVVAAVDGNFDRNTAAGNAPANYVKVDHGNGWQTLYYHFARGSVAVKVGDTVKAGQLLALMGSSGSSTGPHTHYTAIYRGCNVEAGFAPDSYWANPLPYAGDVPPFVLNAGVSNVNPSADIGEGASPIGSVPTSGSGTLYFWTQVYNLKPTDTLTVVWYRPNGTVYTTNNFTPSVAYRFSWWYTTWALSNYQSAPGTWQVARLLNGVEQQRASFVVAAAAEPSIRVADGATTAGPVVLDGRTTAIDLGTLVQGATAVQRSFTVQNHGYATLTLANLTVPQGFTVVAAPISVAAGSTATLTIAMASAVVGDKFGSVRFDTNDPDVGTFEFAVSGSVTGTVNANAPVIGLTGNPAAAYAFGLAPRALSPAATVTDADSANFAGGTLTVTLATFAAADDRLAVANQGTAAGQVGVSGATVTYGGTAVATFAGGSGTTPLTFTLTAAATPAATQALLRALTYSNVAATPTLQRKAVRFTLTDGTGLTSNLAIQHVVNVGRPTPLLTAVPAAALVAGGTYAAAGRFTDFYGSGWTATVNYGDGTGPQPLTLNADKTFALSHAYAAAGAFTATVTVTNAAGGTATATAAVTVVAPARVAAIAVNGGAAQRSTVTSIAVRFDQVVTPASTAAAAFVLTRDGTATPVAATVSLAVVNSVTVATLTFPTLPGASLVDGTYQLTVVGAQLRFGGVAIDGDGNGTAGGDKVLALHRYLGDADGDMAVDGNDLAALAQALNSVVGDANYVAWLDLDGDGAIDGNDLAVVAQRFNTVL